MSRSAALAAVALPALILGAWGAWLSAPRPLSAAAQDIDAVLASEPEVLVIGNSASHQGIDEVALGAALGAKAAKIYVPGSRSPAWYAMLSNRVIGGGHRPRVVLVVAALHHMLDTAMDEEQARHLREQMDEDDALLEARAFRGSWWTARRSEAQDAAARLLEAPRLAVVGALWGSGRGELIGEGRAVAEPALGRLFAIDGGTDLSLGRAAGLPGQGAAPPGGDLTTMDLDGAMITDIVQLANEAGIKVVFVSFPLPAANQTPRPGLDWQARVIRRLNELGAGWIDLSLAELPPAAWGDSIHLQQVGRDRFTALLIEALKPLDPLGDHALPKAPMPLVASHIGRTGAPDPIALRPAPPSPDCSRNFPAPTLGALSDKALQDRLGVVGASPIVLLRDAAPLRAHVLPQEQGCSDAFLHGTQGITAGVSADGAWSLAWSDASPAIGHVGNREQPLWWVYPGTTLRVSFDDAWDPARGDLVVQADAVLFGAGSLTLAAHDVSAAIQADGPVAARLAPAPPPGPWSVDVTAPSGGPPALLTALTLGEGVRAVPLFGERADADLRLIGARHRARTFRSTGEVPPLPLDLTPAEAPPAGGLPRARLDLGAYNQLAPGAVQAKTAIGECSPLLLLEDGVVMPPRRSGAGAWEAQPGGVLLTATDGTDPVHNGRRYSVALSPERGCKESSWLYPGDELVVTLDPLGALPRGGASLDLAATAFSAGSGAVSVEVEVDGVVRYRGPAPSIDPVARVPLDPPVPAGAARLVLTLRAPADAPLMLLRSAALIAPAPPLIARSPALGQ